MGIDSPKPGQAGPAPSGAMTVTQAMLSEGARVYLAHDERFEPFEVAAYRIFCAMLSRSNYREIEVALAADAERFVSPYVTTEVGT